MFGGGGAKTPAPGSYAYDMCMHIYIYIYIYIKYVYKISSVYVSDISQFIYYSYYLIPLPSVGQDIENIIDIHI